jgi:hypothetical protein
MEEGEIRNQTCGSCYRYYLKTEGTKSRGKPRQVRITERRCTSRDEGHRKLYAEHGFQAARRCPGFGRPQYHNM